jgi:hypothetical protein
VDPTTAKGLSILGFFSEGLRNITARYGEAMPWEAEGGPPPALPRHPDCTSFGSGDVPFFCEDGAAGQAARSRVRPHTGDFLEAYDDWSDAEEDAEDQAPPPPKVCRGRPSPNARSRC